MAEQNTKREQILRATLELILENGLQAASMSLISRRAEVPVGTIYRIFPGKEALVNALYQECRDLLFASITDPRGEDLPPREAFHAMFGRYIRTALEHREEFLFVEQFCHLMISLQCTDIITHRMLHTVKSSHQFSHLIPVLHRQIRHIKMVFLHLTAQTCQLHHRFH